LSVNGRQTVPDLQSVIGEGSLSPEQLHVQQVFESWHSAVVLY